MSRGATIWDARTGAKVAGLRVWGSYDPATYVAWSPVGTMAATATTWEAVRIWRTADWTVLHTLTGHFTFGWTVPSPTQCASWSPDGTRLATVDNNTTRIWDATTGELLRSIEVPRVPEAAWSPVVPGLATLTGQPQLWDPVDGALRLSVTEARWGGWSPNGARFVTSTQIWDSANGSLVHDLVQREAGAWAPVGEFLATVHSQVVRIWRIPPT